MRKISKQVRGSENGTPTAIWTITRDDGTPLGTIAALYSPQPGTPSGWAVVSYVVNTDTAIAETFDVRAYGGKAATALAAAKRRALG